MTDPLLTYQTPAPGLNTGLRTATWIYLLILGILYCVGGLCMGGGLGFTFGIMSKAVAGGPPPGVGTIFVIIAIVVVLVGGGLGTAFIWSALRIRRGSRAAFITALVLAILTTCMFLGVVILGLVGMLSDGHWEATMIIAVLFYLLPAAINAAAIFLLIALQRQSRRAAFVTP